MVIVICYVINPMSFDVPSVTNYLIKLFVWYDSVNHFYGYLYASVTLVICLSVIPQGQFFILITHTGYGLYINCDFDKRPMIALFFYLISHILLFSNFYRHAYSKSKKRNENTEKWAESNGLVEHKKEQ